MADAGKKVAFSPLGVLQGEAESMHALVLLLLPVLQLLVVARQLFHGLGAEYGVAYCLAILFQFRQHFFGHRSAFFRSKV